MGGQYEDDKRRAWKDQQQGEAERPRTEQDKRDTPRKERVIHTRISLPLEKALKDTAEDLGLSVSTLVRNLLTNTIDLVEDAVVDSARVADSARGVHVDAESARRAGRAAANESRRAAAPAAPVASKTLGWQTFTLALNAICADCNDILPRGTEAARAVVDPPTSQPIICLVCMKRKSKSADRNP